MFIWESVYLGCTRKQVCTAQKGKDFFFSHFCLKIVQILGPAFWTKVGHGVGAAVESIYLFIIQQIVTMPIYGKETLNTCHPT